jgi:hypothetical protein
MIARSFGQLEQRPGRAWMELFYAASSRPGFLEALDPMGAERIIWGLASMGCKPSEGWLDRFYAATGHLLLRCNVLNLCGMAWGLVRMGVTPADAWMECFAAAFDQRLTQLVKEEVVTSLRRGQGSPGLVAWRDLASLSRSASTGREPSGTDEKVVVSSSTSAISSSGRSVGEAGWRQKLGLGGQLALLRALYALKLLHPAIWRKWRHLGVLLEQ